MYVIVGQGAPSSAHKLVCVDLSFTIWKPESQRRCRVHEVRKYVGLSTRMNQSGWREGVDGRHRHHPGDTVEVGKRILVRVGEERGVGAGAGAGAGAGIEGEEPEAEAEVEPEPVENS